MNKRNKIIVSIVGITIVLLALLGITYAYYLTRIEGNTNTNSISITTADLKLVYGDGKGSVTKENIMPGTTIEKTFTVTNDGNNKVDLYAVYLEELVNTLSRTPDLTYVLTCESTGEDCDGAEGEFPTLAGMIVTNSIDTDVTHTYKLTVTYKNEENIDQSIDMGSRISAFVQIYALKDIVDIEGSVTGAADGDFAQINSVQKRSQIVDGKYKFAGVLPGTHTLKICEKTDTNCTNPKLTKSIVINLGDEAKVDGNTITITDESQTATININLSAQVETDKVQISTTIKEYSPFFDVLLTKLLTCEKIDGKYIEDNCVFTGATPDNYLWYSGFMWRIIGLNDDGTIKAITKNPVGLAAWGKDLRSYESSYVRNWLNELDSSDELDGIFYNALDNPSTYLVKRKWDISSVSETIVMSDFEDYVGMITEREYKRASSNNDVSKDNWLNISSEYMTMTLAGWDSEEIYVRNVDSTGNLVFRTQTTAYGAAHSNIILNGVSYSARDFKYNNPEGVRPVVNFKSSLVIGGNGTENNPYYIKSELPASSDNYLNTRNSGEYLMFSGLVWRIMKTSSEGTKIILNDYMKNGSSYVKKAYSTVTNDSYSATPYYQTARFRVDEDTNIGYYLNNTYYLSLAQNSWIVSSKFANSTYGDSNDNSKLNKNDYKTSLTEVADREVDKTYSGRKYYSTFYYTPVEAKIGLSSIGELFSGNDVNLKDACNCGTSCNNCYKATMTQDDYYTSYSLKSMGIDGTANASVMPNLNSFLYRPVTMLNSTIKIAGGSGTPLDPYVLKN